MCGTRTNSVGLMENHGEVRFLLYNGRSRGHVNDHLVSLNEQQFVDLFLRGLTSFTLFPELLFLVQYRIREFHSVDISVFFCFLNSDEFVTAHAC